MHQEFQTAQPRMDMTQMEKMFHAISNILLQVNNTNQTLLSFLSSQDTTPNRIGAKVWPTPFSGLPSEDVLAWLWSFWEHSKLSPMVRGAESAINSNIVRKRRSNMVYPAERGHQAKLDSTKVHPDPKFCPSKHDPNNTSTTPSTKATTLWTCHTVCSKAKSATPTRRSDNVWGNEVVFHLAAFETWHFPSSPRSRSNIFAWCHTNRTTSAICDHGRVFLFLQHNLFYSDNQ